MKKFLFLAAALIAMGCGMSSCSNEAEVTEQTEQAPKLTKLTFTVAQDAQTRVAWGGANNRTPMFEDGEFVSLFSENNDNVKLTVNVDGDGNVTLTGMGTAGDDNLYFVYPWDENATIEGGRITSEYLDGPYSFNDGVIYPSDKYPSNALSFAKSTDGGATAITFQGLMAIIKFTPAANCTGYIKVKAGASVILNDILAINPAGPSIEGYYGGTTATYMNFPDGNFDFTADTPYYIALHPFTMSAGGTISFVDNEGEHIIYTASANKDFVAGKIYKLSYGAAPAADPHLLPGSFSVSATKKVKFTKSNLYWDGSAFHFEDKPTDYPTTRATTHVGHFFWATTAEKSYAASYDGTGATTSDQFFADGSDAEHKLTVDGISNLYVLSAGEWDYLLRNRGNAGNLRKWGVTVGGKADCLVIAPDGFSGTIENTYTLEDLETAGLVCLPAAGYFFGGSVSETGSYGAYWSSTPDAGYVSSARYLEFVSGDADVYPDFRYCGYSLRAVLAQ